MEIKTTKEIKENTYWKNGFKKWVAVEDVIKLFEDDSILCFEDLKNIINSKLKPKEEFTRVGYYEDENGN